MNKAIVLIFLILSTIEVNAGSVSDLLGFASKVNFGGLNKWLEETLPEEDDLQRNLDQVKTNLDQLSGSKAKRAAELFVEFMEAQQCDDHLLTNVKEILRSGADMGRGLNRVDIMMGSRMSFVAQICGRFLDKRVNNFYRSSLEPSIGRFLEVVVLRDNKWRAPIGASLIPSPDNKFYDYIKDGRHGDIYERSVGWANHLQELAMGDPRSLTKAEKFSEITGQYTTIHFKRNFRHIYNKYLVKPCQLLTSTLGDTVSDLQVLSQQDSSFIYMRSIAVKQLLYAFQRCKALLSKRSSAIYKLL